MYLHEHLDPKAHNSAAAGGNSSAGNGRPDDEENLAAEPRPKGKAKAKAGGVAKVLLGLAVATQMDVGQSMLIFASVASLVE